MRERLHAASSFLIKINKRIYSLSVRTLFANMVVASIIGLGPSFRPGAITHPQHPSVEPGTRACSIRAENIRVQDRGFNIVLLAMPECVS